MGQSPEPLLVLESRWGGGEGSWRDPSHCRKKAGTPAALGVDVVDRAWLQGTGRAIPQHGCGFPRGLG